MTAGASEVPKSRALNCCSMIQRFSSMTRGMFLSMIAKRAINAAELQSRIDYRARPMTGSDVGPAYSPAARELCRLIHDGELVSGERLPVEADLVGDFGVSRSTVREAFRSLTIQNLTATKRGVSGSTFVNRPDAVQGSDSLTTGLGFLAVADELTVAELLEAREMLEVPATRSAAQLRSTEQLERIFGLLRPRAGSDFAPTFDSNVGFHRRIVEASGNCLLEVMARSIFYVLQSRFLRYATPKRFWPQVDGERRRIAVSPYLSRQVTPSWRASR